MNKKDDLVKDLMTGIEKFDDGYQSEIVAMSKRTVKRFVMAAGAVTWTFVVAGVSYQVGVSSVGCAVLSLEQSRGIEALGTVVAERKGIPRTELWYEMFKELGQPTSHTSINKCNYDAQMEWLLRAANA